MNPDCAIARIAGTGAQGYMYLPVLITRLCARSYRPDRSASHVPQWIPKADSNDPTPRRSTYPY
jgi:hypothetical protein